MLLGLVSDAHCNAPALRWALDHLRDSVDEILFAGDAIHEYRFSDEVIAMLRGCGAKFVLGNHEVQFLRSRSQGQPLKADPANLAFVESSPLRLDTIAGGKKLTMVHGVPWPPFSDYVYRSSPQLKRFAELDADIVVVGHTHVPMVERVGTTLVVNPGSIGEARGSRNGLSFATIDSTTEEVTIHRFPPDIAPPTG